MFVWAAREERAMGAINATAPEPVTNATLTNRLSRALGRPALMPVPQAALRLILGEFADTILGGQRALPSAAKRLGFTYALPELEAALGVALSA
jgi:NAD dependent epimerase/dehydratase family enzyme